jgi:hypothetical protein
LLNPKSRFFDGSLSGFWWQKVLLLVSLSLERRFGFTKQLFAFGKLQCEIIKILQVLG